MTLRLVKPTQPRTGTASFKKIAEILKTGTWEFPNDGKYNGSGGPGVIHGADNKNYTAVVMPLRG
jgi:hypothetical protein